MVDFGVVVPRVFRGGLAVVGPWSFREGGAREGCVSPGRRDGYVKLEGHMCLRGEASGWEGVSVHGIGGGG